VSTIKRTEELEREHFDWFNEWRQKHGAFGWFNEQASVVRFVAREISRNQSIFSSRSPNFQHFERQSNNAFSMLGCANEQGLVWFRSCTSSCIKQIMNIHRHFNFPGTKKKTQWCFLGYAVSCAAALKIFHPMRVRLGIQRKVPWLRFSVVVDVKVYLWQRVKGITTSRGWVNKSMKKQKQLSNHLT